MELRSKVQTLEHGQKKKSKLSQQQRRFMKSLRLCSVSVLVVVSAILWFSWSDVKVAPGTVETAVNRCFDILEEVTNKDMQEKTKLRQEIAEIRKRTAALQQEFDELQERNTTRINETTVRLKQHEETPAIPRLDKQDEAASTMEVTDMKSRIGRGAHEREELKFEYQTPRETADEKQTNWSEFHLQIASKMEEYNAELVDIRIKIRVLEEQSCARSAEQIVPRELLWSLATLVVVVLVIVFPIFSIHNRTFVNKLSQFSKKQEANMEHLAQRIDAQGGKLNQLAEKQEADRKTFKQETDTQRGRMDQLTKKQESDREQFVQEVDAQRGVTDQLSEQQEADREQFMQEIDAQNRKMDQLTKKQETDREHLVQEVTEVRNNLQVSRAVPEAPHVIPFQTTMPDFFKHRTASGSWCSEPFYTHSCGYKMCLVVHANGVGDSEGKGVSVFLYLMRGDFDGELAWPFQGKVTISLLNQFEDSGHREITLSFKQNGDRVIEGERAASGPGEESLVSYRDLSYVSDLHTQYLKHDSLRFRVSKVDLNDDSAAVPVGVVMTDFEGRKKNTKGLFRASEKWFSEPFYTHPGGYKMCLSVVTNGCGDGQSTHISIYIFLMRGEHDEQLKWPFCGAITIQLLNQKADGEHWEKTVEIYARRVMFWHDRATCGRGHTKFIAHTELCTQDKEYVQNDSLKFQISKVVIKAA